MLLAGKPPTIPLIKRDFIGKGRMDEDFLVALKNAYAKRILGLW